MRKETSMKHIIDVENIKCGGCANTIMKTLGKLDGVEQVSVDIEQGRVSVDSANDNRAQLVETLLHNGYPEKGTAQGIQAATAKARSFVSCAIGKIG
jgi:copper chaperone